MYPLKRWKISKEKCERNFRRIWKRKMAHEIIEIILDKIEYYNLKKVTGIQAFFRGVLMRMKFKKKIVRLRKLQFKHKMERKRSQLARTMSLIVKLKKSQVNNERRVIWADNMFNISILLRDKMKKMRKQIKMKKTLNHLVLRYRFIRLGQKIRHKKKCEWIVFRFLRNRIFAQKIKDRIASKRLKKEIKKMMPFKKEWIKEEKRCLKKSGFESIKFSLFKNKIQKLKSEKLDIYYQNIGLNLVENFVAKLKVMNVFYEIINKIKNQNDNILGIGLQSSYLSILTKKLVFYLVDLEKNEFYALKLPSKILQLKVFDGCLIYINEDHSIDYNLIEFKSNKSAIKILEDDYDGFFINAIKDQNWKIMRINFRGNKFLCSTNCHKLIYCKDAMESTEIPLTFQFKRIIKSFAMGHDFFIASDDTGILYSYGNNDRGQLGIGYGKKSNSLNIIDRIVNRKEIIKTFDCGKYHTVAITMNNKIYGWGDNSYYQLGSKTRNQFECVFTPKLISYKKFLDKKVKNLIQVKCGKFSSYFLFLSKKLFALGKKNLTIIFQQPAEINLSEILTMNDFPLQLNVKYNENIEIVYLRCLNFNKNKFKSIASFKKFCEIMFENLIHREECKLKSLHSL